LLTEVSVSKVHYIPRNLSPKKPKTTAAILKQMLSGQARLGWAGLGWAGLGWAGLGWAAKRDVMSHYSPGKRVCSSR